MPFNGSGVYQRTKNWVNDRDASIKITAERHDEEDDAFAEGLSECITKDGQTVIEQDIPFNGKKITGLATATASTDAANLGNITAITDDLQTEIDAAEVDIATNAAAITDLGLGKQKETLAAHKKLRVVNNSTNPTYQMDVTADKIAVYNGTDKQKNYTSFSGTVDITASGANGLDTGSEAVSSWYYIHVIAKEDDTKALLLSLSETSPTMPTDYVYSGLVGAVYNSSAGDFMVFEQLDKRVATYTTPEVVTSGNNASLTALDLSALVPPNARIVYGWGYGRHSTTAARYGYIAANASDYGLTIISGGNQSGSGYIRAGNFALPMMVAQTIYYKVSASASYNFTIQVGPWSY